MKDSHLEFLLEDLEKDDIPVDEDVELNLGAARHVKIEPVLIETATTNHQFDSKGNIDGWDEIRKFAVNVCNSRSIDVEVEITRNFGTAYWQLEKTGNYGQFEKEDFDTVKFTLKMKPGSKREFTYTLTTNHGKRTESR